jgi:phosphatidylcholine synthase
MSAPLATPLRRALAWAVHLYTALGAVLALLAIEATVDGDARAAFLWMGAALFIDSTDGVLARTVRVKEVVPTYDGAKLDDIVDYLNYVVVPIFFAVRMNMIPAWCATPVAALPLLASAYGFCTSAAKTADFFFTGFPSYWNIAVFYMYVLGTSAGLNAAILVTLAALVFVPIGYVYPTRQPFLRPLTLSLGALWGLLLVIALARMPSPSPPLVFASLAFPVYYFALSGYLQLRRA